ncbi:hypothetical protein, partial [Novispirillum itersonii]|uniref:hypothetical protein n=1 Tax=Novispirillum itersonii TaxID=189 RepID=UPI000475DF3C
KGAGLTAREKTARVGIVPKVAVRRVASQGIVRAAKEAGLTARGKTVRVGIVLTGAVRVLAGLARPGHGRIDKGAG